MRFPFFTLRGKSKNENAAKKSSRICCLQAPTPNARPLRPDGSDMTVVIHETATPDGNAYLRGSFFGLGRPSKSSSLDTSMSTSEASDSTTEALRAFRHPIRANVESEVATSDVSSCSEDVPTPFYRSRPGHTSPPKGPGLGSVNDSLPTRQQRETPRAGFDDIVSHRLSRRASNEVTAPELPTRLEVCMDNGRSRMGPSAHVVDSAVSMNRRNAVLSHAIPEPISPFDDSLSPRAHSPQPLASHAVGSVHRPSSEASRSRSPTQSSRHSESALQEEISDRPTKQQMETQWDFAANGSFGPNETELNLVGTREETGVPHVADNATPRLHQWHMYLKLNWLSEASNDLVAEVCLLDEKTAEGVPGTASSGASCRTCYETYSSRLASGYASYSNLNAGPETSRHSSATDKQCNIIYVVDRALSELQKQKRSSRNKQRPAIEELLDRRSSVEKKTHGRRLTERQSTAFGTEHYREVCSPVQRIRHRQEVLQAFEVLITKKEVKIAASDGSGATGASLSEKILTEAVLYDLRQEISRLDVELQNKALSYGLPQALANVHRSMPSHEYREPAGDSHGNAFAQRVGSRWKRTKSDPTASGRPYDALPTSKPSCRSISCSGEIQSSPHVLLASCLPDRRDSTNERLAKIALLNEEMLFMKGTDCDARAA